jgi:hypothetical protein
MTAMPLEINEIDIAMRVTGADGADASGDGNARTPASEVDLEDLVEECVRRVLQALRVQSEP